MGPKGTPSHSLDWIIESDEISDGKPKWPPLFESLSAGYLVRYVLRLDGFGISQPFVKADGLNWGLPRWSHIGPLKGRFGSANVAKVPASLPMSDMICSYWPCSNLSL